VCRQQERDLHGGTRFIRADHAERPPVSPRSHEGAARPARRQDGVIASRQPLMVLSQMAFVVRFVMFNDRK